MDLDELERLRRLAAWEPVFADPAFSPGGMFRGPSPAVVRFAREMADLGWSTRGDYGPWSQSEAGLAFTKDNARIPTATSDELALLLTTIMRMDRFSRGVLDEAFGRGTILAIVRRARVLVGTTQNERPPAGPQGSSESSTS